MNYKIIIKTDYEEKVRPRDMHKIEHLFEGSIEWSLNKWSILGFRAYLQHQIVTELLKIKDQITFDSNGQFEYDQVYMSPILYEIIMQDAMGYIRDIEVHIDTNLKCNLLKLSTSLPKSRDYKLSSILDNDSSIYIEPLIQIYIDPISDDSEESSERFIYQLTKHAGLYFF